MYNIYLPPTSIRIKQARIAQFAALRACSSQDVWAIASLCPLRHETPAYTLSYQNTMLRRETCFYTHSFTGSPFVPLY